MKRSPPLFLHNCIIIPCPAGGNKAKIREIGRKRQAGKLREESAGLEKSLLLGWSCAKLYLKIFTKMVINSQIAKIMNRWKEKYKKTKAGSYRARRRRAHFRTHARGNGNGGSPQGNCGQAGVVFAKGILIWRCIFGEKVCISSVYSGASACHGRDGSRGCL